MAKEERMTKKERKQLRREKKLLDKAAQERSSSMKKMVNLLIIGLILLTVGYVAYNQYVPIPEGEQEKTVNQVMEGDWLKGSVDAKVVLVEYSDFQCPACASYVGVLKDLSDMFGDDLAIVYRHFPLKQIHVQAELAAQATEAAGNQGKFWEMHDLIFSSQDKWSESSGAKKQFISMAEELGLDIDKFKKDLSSKEVRGRVKADFLSGLSLRLNSTPSFFLNGERIQNPSSPQAFEELIREVLPSTASAELGDGL